MRAKGSLCMWWRFYGTWIWWRLYGTWIHQCSMWVFGDENRSYIRFNIAIRDLSASAQNTKYETKVHNHSLKITKTNIYFRDFERVLMNFYFIFCILLLTGTSPRDTSTISWRNYSQLHVLLELHRCMYMLIGLLKHRTSSSRQA
jgi:hypothetical protein